MAKYTVTLIPLGSVIWLCLANLMNVWYLWTLVLIDLQMMLLGAMAAVFDLVLNVVLCVADVGLQASPIFLCFCFCFLSYTLKITFWRQPSNCGTYTEDTFLCNFPKKLFKLCWRKKKDDRYYAVNVLLWHRAPDRGQKQACCYTLNSKEYCLNYLSRHVFASPPWRGPLLLYFSSKTPVKLNSKEPLFSALL